MHFFFVCKILEITATKLVILIDWLIDWLIAVFSIQWIHTSTTIYMVYMTRTLYLISVLYWRMKVTNERDVVSQVYTDWEVIKNPIFLTWTLQFCITHYIISRVCQRCSSASCSCNHWAMSHLFTVRVERSRLFSCQTIISIQSLEVIWSGSLYLFLGCRSVSRLSLKCHILYASQAVFVDYCEKLVFLVPDFSVPHNYCTTNIGTCNICDKDYAFFITNVK